MSLLRQYLIVQKKKLKSSRGMMKNLALVFTFLIMMLSSAYAIENDKTDADESENNATNTDDEKSAVIENHAESEENPALDGVTVRAKRKKHPGIRVQKYDKIKLEQEGVKRASDALELLPSVQSGTTSRGERKFILRGFDDRQIRVLVDGMPLMAPYTGRTDLFKIPAEIIDSIEVVKGGGSIAYGPQGLGGAINIVTRKAGSKPFLLLNYEMMELDGRSLAVAASDSISFFHWLITAGYDQQDGFRMPDSFEEKRNEDGGMRNNSDRFDWHIAAKGAFDINHNHQLLTDITYFRGKYGVPPHITDLSPRYWKWDSWEDLNLSVTHVGRYGDTVKVEESVFAVFLNNTLDSYDDANYDTQDSLAAYHSTYRDRIIGARVKALAKFFPELVHGMTLRGYFDIHHDYHESDWEDRDEVESTERLGLTAVPEIEVAFLKWFSMIASFQTEIDLPIDSGDYKADPSWIWGPMLDFKFKLPDNVTIELSAARRGRFPTLSERYGTTGGGRVPNPGLKAETAWNASLDVSYKYQEMFIISIGGFHSEVSDLILETSIGGGQTQIQNLSRARLSGFEINAGMDFDFGFEFEIGYAFLRAESLDDKKDMEYMPEHKAFLSVAEEPVQWLRISSRIEFVGPQDFFNDDIYRFDEMDSYLKWNARVDFMPVKWFKFWFRVTNLLDSLYEPRHGFPDPGRTFWFGLQVKKD